jgi:addiction module RelE/StbE family toxin
MKLYWTERSRQDLLAIGRYIARDNPHTARVWVERLRSRARAAAKTPRAGRMVPEWESKEVREVFLRNYRIVYRVLKDSIHIITFEGHRRLERNS